MEAECCVSIKLFFVLCIFRQVNVWLVDLTMTTFLEVSWSFLKFFEHVSLAAACWAVHVTVADLLSNDVAGAVQCCNNFRIGVSK